MKGTSDLKERNEHLQIIAQLLYELLEDNRQSDRAKKMSQYMRNHFAFYGVTSPERKTLQKKWLQHIPKDLSQSQRKELVLLLWNHPMREVHYVACDWINSWKKEQLNSHDHELLFHLMTHNAWWDSIDSLAPGVFANYIRWFPEQGQTIIENWRRNENFWLRRSCIIHQLKAKQEVNEGLLYSLILENINDKEFFIQKAIGWSLRQYAKYNPTSVKKFVSNQPLSNFAKREATKHLSKIS
jgi:3-methyladenine DNA glycosylase AlkD